MSILFGPIGLVLPLGIAYGPFTIGVPKKRKKDFIFFLRLLFTNNIYMKKN
jgi:hypothetical protein